MTRCLYNLGSKAQGKNQSLIRVKSNEQGKNEGIEGQLHYLGILMLDA